MAKPFNELRERLLQAGVAPRHVRRYLRELSGHLADLRAEGEAAGRTPAEAEKAALLRLGSVESLAQAMIQQPQFHSWCARAPWAIFGLGSLLFLAAAYFLACVYLWCGWTVFLPAADTPFGGRVGSMYSLANIYFQAGKFYYTCVPIFVGWAIGLVAARQRLKAVWPALAFVLVAAMAATAHIRAGRTAVPGVGHIRMSFFTLSPAGPLLSVRLIYASVVLTLVTLPYVLWRWHQARSFPASPPVR